MVRESASGTQHPTLHPFRLRKACFQGFFRGFRCWVATLHGPYGPDLALGVGVPCRVLVGCRPNARVAGKWPETGRFLVAPSMCRVLGRLLAGTITKFPTSLRSDSAP
jgi:hypothetical protein